MNVCRKGWVASWLEMKKKVPGKEGAMNVEEYNGDVCSQSMLIFDET